MDTEIGTYLIGISLSGCLGLLVAVYLQTCLKNILKDLCGTEARVAFWMAYTNVVLVGVPMAFSMMSTPDRSNPLPAVLQISGQLKWALLGLLMAVAICGRGIVDFIPRQGGAK